MWRSSRYHFACGFTARGGISATVTGAGTYGIEGMSGAERIKLRIATMDDCMHVRDAAVLFPGTLWTLVDSEGRAICYCVAEDPDEIRRQFARFGLVVAKGSGVGR